MGAGGNYLRREIFIRVTQKCSEKKIYTTNLILEIYEASGGLEAVQDQNRFNINTEESKANKRSSKY